MFKPFTKTDKDHAEKVIKEKIKVLADNAKSMDDIELVQELIKNQVEIEESKKARILGIELKDWFVGAVSMAQLMAVLKYEDLKVLTSKAINFVHKGRLR